MGLIAHFPFEGTIENVAGMKALSGATDYTEIALKLLEVILLPLQTRANPPQLL